MLYIAIAPISIAMGGIPTFFFTKPQQATRLFSMFVSAREQEEDIDDIHDLVDELLTETEGQLIAVCAVSTDEGYRDQVLELINSRIGARSGFLLYKDDTDEKLLAGETGIETIEISSRDPAEAELFSGITIQ